MDVVAELDFETALLTNAKTIPIQITEKTIRGIAA